MYLTVLAANQAVITALSTLVASGIAGFVAWLVAKQSRKGITDAAATTSRSDLERDAYTRAETYYTNLVANQDRRIAALLERAESAESKADRAEQEAHQANQSSENCQLEIRELQKQVEHYRAIGRRLAKVILDKQGKLDDPAVHEAVMTFVSDGDDLPKV